MKFYSIILLTILTTACNVEENILVKGVDLHEESVDGDRRIHFEAILSLGDLKLPNSNSSIRDIQKTPLGELTTEQLKDGTNRLAASIDLEKINKLDSKSGVQLPNGRFLSELYPKAGPVHEIPIFENSKIYISSSSDNNLLIGLALNIPAFEPILSKDRKNLAVFDNFPFSSSINATAGIYSSPDQGKNGLAIIATRMNHPLSNGQRRPASVHEKGLERLSALSRFRLNYLFTKNATLRVK